MRFAKRGAQFIMLNIGAETPGFYMYLTTIWMVAQQSSGFFRGFGKQINGAVDANGQHIIFTWQAGIAPLIFEIGAKPANTGLNHIAGFRVCFNVAWQCQQPKRRLQIKLAGIRPFRKRGAFWLFRLRIADLHIGAIGAVAQKHRQFSGRVNTQFGVGHSASAIAIGIRQLSGEFTFRVI